MDGKIKVGLIEDQYLFRKGMRAILSSQPEIDVVFESAEGYTVIEKLLQSVIIPDVMLVDLSLPPNGKIEFSGKEVTIALREKYPEIKIIILSAHEDENSIAQLIEHGAHSYLVKDNDPNEVFEAISSVYHKGSYINGRTLSAIQNNLNRKTPIRSQVSSPEQPTKREEEILELICMQLTTAEIAEKLSISPKTVNSHRNSLLQKTGAHNVAGLVLYAVKNGLVKL